MLNVQIKWYNVFLFAIVFVLARNCFFSSSNQPLCSRAKHKITTVDQFDFYEIDKYGNSNNKTQSEIQVERTNQNSVCTATRKIIDTKW